MEIAPGPDYVRRIAAALRERLDELVARIIVRVTDEVPDYVDPSVQAGYGESVRTLAGMIVQGQWLEGRQPSVEDEVKVQALGAQRARQGVGLSSVRHSLRLAEEVGMELLFDIAKGLARLDKRGDYQGLDALDVMRSQLHAFMERIQNLMTSGYSEHLARDPPTLSALDAVRLADLGRSSAVLAAGVASVMARAVWEGPRYTDFKHTPELRQEIEVAMSQSTEMFFTCLAEGRRMTPDEAVMVSSFAARGAHREIPTDLLEEAMRDAAASGFLMATYDPALEFDRQRMTAPLSLALQAFTDDLIRGVREARERQGTWAPLGSGLWLDSEVGRVRSSDGRSVKLARRELEILEVLAAAPGTYQSSVRIGRVLGSIGGYPLDPHAIAQLTYRLRLKLGMLSGGFRVIDSRRGMGYALHPESRTI